MTSEVQASLRAPAVPTSDVQGSVEPAAKPAIKRVGALGAIAAATCSKCATHVPSCAGGIPACQKPKPRLDTLPIVAPTLFRKYEPCTEPDAPATVVTPTPVPLPAK